MPHMNRTQRPQQDSHHSEHSGERSRRYHAEVIEATPIDRGPTKMTRQAATRGKTEEAWDR